MNTPRDSGNFYQCAGRLEIWEFLSAWSETYGLDCDESLIGSINASLKDANVNMRRAVGNIVDDVNAKRMQAQNLLQTPHTVSFIFLSVFM